MPPDLALLSTLSGLNYPCLELIFMVPKVFEPLQFDCMWYFSVKIGHRVSFCVKAHALVQFQKSGAYGIDLKN